MVDRYKETLKIAQNKLENIGFYIEEDSDFSTTFGNGTDWKLLFWGERYTDLYGLEIMNTKFKNKLTQRTLWYNLGYLTVVLIGKNSMTFSQKLDFLIENKEKIFDETFPYKDEYDNLNSI